MYRSLPIGHVEGEKSKKISVPEARIIAVRFRTTVELIECRGPASAVDV